MTIPLSLWGLLPLSVNCDAERLSEIPVFLPNAFMLGVTLGSQTHIERCRRLSHLAETINLAAL
jgi:hypothetical protein